MKKREFDTPAPLEERTFLSSSEPVGGGLGRPVAWVIEASDGHPPSIHKARWSPSTPPQRSLQPGTGSP
jgi:hypothetical protein